jgi:hypothetical protein
LRNVPLDGEAPPPSKTEALRRDPEWQRPDVCDRAFAIAARCAPYRDDLALALDYGRLSCVFAALLLVSFRRLCIIGSSRLHGAFRLKVSIDKLRRRSPCPLGLLGLTSDQLQPSNSNGLVGSGGGVAWVGNGRRRPRALRAVWALRAVSLLRAARSGSLFLMTPTPASTERFQKCQ